MTRLARAFATALALMPFPALAGTAFGVAAEVYVLGEVHDNPAHHLVQREAIAEIQPSAIVFEMLSPEQVAAIRPELLDDPLALAAALDWEASGWPDFAMYYPLFTVAREAVVIGAEVPRDETRRAMEIGVPVAFGEGAETYGLTEPLEEHQFADRLNLQLEAHCGMLPTELLPAMVDVQRLRDATLARAAIEALAATGGPVVVITGNGHARKDWGVPSYIARVAPEVTVFALGQGEDGGTPEGGFDKVLDASAVERPDPCLAFQ